MSWCPKYLISVYVVAALVGSAGVDGAPQSFLEGNLKIISPREVELADGTPSQMTAENYADYPVVILSPDRKKEVARVTADANGNYRVALAPGDYILDVQDRKRRHVRATPRRFTVASNQTVRVDMTIDTGVR